MPTTRSDAAPFAPLPVVAVDHPDDWQPLLADGAHLAVAERDAASVFRANVAVTVRRVLTGASGPGSALETAIQENTAALEAAERWAELGSEYRTVLGLDGYRIEGAFVMPQIGTVFQAVQLAVVEHDGFADVIGITGTSGADRQELVPTIREVIASARLV